MVTKRQKLPSTERGRYLDVSSPYMNRYGGGCVPKSRPFLIASSDWLAWTNTTTPWMKRFLNPLDVFGDLTHLTYVHWSASTGKHLQSECE